MAKTALFAGSFDPYTVGHHALVERALQMFDKVIVVVNKVDKPEARPREVVDEVLELFIDQRCNLERDFYEFMIERTNMQELAAGSQAVNYGEYE